MRSYLHRYTLFFALILCVLAGCNPASNTGAQADTSRLHPKHYEVSVDALPSEAQRVVEQILAEAPFTHPRDGSVFHNRERLLPQQASGYYREYTVPTPGVRNRGARRLVTGGKPPTELFYTDDHYRSFTRVRISAP